MIGKLVFSGPQGAISNTFSRYSNRNDGRDTGTVMMFTSVRLGLMTTYDSRIMYSFFNRLRTL